MWDFVGIVRNDERLIRAKKRINLLQEEVIDYYRRHRVTNDLLELRNLVLVSSLIIDSALSRKSHAAYTSRKIIQTSRLRPRTLIFLLQSKSPRRKIGCVSVK